MHRRTLFALMAAAPPARAQASLALYTAGPGSAFLPYGEGLARHLAAAGLAVEVRRSAGSLENLSRLEDDTAAIGTAFLGSVQDALEGTAAAGGRRHTQLRALFPMYETSFQVAALRASGIGEFAALAGRRVGVGPARGPAEVFFRATLEAAGSTAEIVNGDPAALAEALVEGRIDALWQGAVVPIPSLLSVLRRADATVFGLPAALVTAITARLPYLAPTVVAAGTYPGQTTPIASFAAWNFVVANAGLPQPQAYAITRAALTAPNPARDIHPSAAATRPASAMFNRLLPFHPGAARALRELGAPPPG